jgi:hypothetical protein
MTDVPESFARYLEAWNERDPTKVADHLAGSLTTDVVFADPANHKVGRVDIEAMIVEARTGSLPDADYVLSSGIDGHHRRFRYRWQVKVGDEVLVDGMDVTTVDDAGRIERIDGFFGDFPDA